MRTKPFVSWAGALAYISCYGRCAITLQKFDDTALICAVLLPQKADWPAPVWDDYPMGTRAKCIAFVLQSAIPSEGLLVGQITEATQCDGRTIHFHPITFKTEEANEAATFQEV